MIDEEVCIAKINPAHATKVRLIASVYLEALLCVLFIWAASGKNMQLALFEKFICTASVICAWLMQTLTTAIQKHVCYSIIFNQVNQLCAAWLQILCTLGFSTLLFHEFSGKVHFDRECSRCRDFGRSHYEFSPGTPCR